MHGHAHVYLSVSQFSPSLCIHNPLADAGTLSTELDHIYDIFHSDGEGLPEDLLEGIRAIRTMLACLPACLAIACLTLLLLSIAFMLCPTGGERVPDPTPRPGPPHEPRHLRPHHHAQKSHGCWHRGRPG